MFKFRTVRGCDVPEEAEKLTRGNTGTLLHWLREEREHMVAVLLYRDNTLIGWCGAIRLRRRKFWLWGDEIYYTNRVQIGTFVEPTYRGKGFAKKLLNKMTWALRLIDPNTVVQYGAPQDDADFFNKTYEDTLTRKGLKPQRYFCT
jgi:GNAT superfamily N-acetyltransferase